MEGNQDRHITPKTCLATTLPVEPKVTSLFRSTLLGIVVSLQETSGVAVFTLNGLTEKARFTREQTSVGRHLVLQSRPLTETLDVGMTVELTLVQPHIEQDKTVRYRALVNVIGYPTSAESPSTSQTSSASKVRTNHQLLNQTFRGTIVELKERSGVAAFFLNGERQFSRFINMGLRMGGVLVTQLASLYDMLYVGAEVRLWFTTPHAEHDATLTFTSFVDVEERTTPLPTRQNVMADIRWEFIDATIEYVYTQGKTGVAVFNNSGTRAQFGVVWFFVDGEQWTVDFAPGFLYKGMPIMLTNLRYRNDVQWSYRADAMVYVFPTDFKGVTTEWKKILMTLIARRRAMYGDIVNKLYLTNRDGNGEKCGYRVDAACDREYYSCKLQVLVELSVDGLGFREKRKRPSVKENRKRGDFNGEILRVKTVLYEGALVTIPTVVGIRDDAGETMVKVYIGDRKTTINGVHVEEYRYLVPEDYFAVGKRVELSNIEFIDKKSPSNGDQDLCEYKATIKVEDSELCFIDIMMSRKEREILEWELDRTVLSVGNLILRQRYISKHEIRIKVVQKMSDKCEREVEEWECGDEWNEEWEWAVCKRQRKWKRNPVGGKRDWEDRRERRERTEYGEWEYEDWTDGSTGWQSDIDDAQVTCVENDMYDNEDTTNTENQKVVGKCGNERLRERWEKQDRASRSKTRILAAPIQLKQEIFVRNQKEIGLSFEETLRKQSKDRVNALQKKVMVWRKTKTSQLKCEMVPVNQKEVRLSSDGILRKQSKGSDNSSRNEMRLLAIGSQVKCEIVVAECVNAENGMNTEHSKHENKTNGASAKKVESTPTSDNIASYPGSIILLSVKSGVATFMMNGREEKARFPRAAASVDGELVPQMTSLAETLLVGDKVRLSVVEKHTEQDVTVRYLARADVIQSLSKTSEPGLLGTKTMSELNQGRKISTDATVSDDPVTEGEQHSRLEIREQDVSETGLRGDKLNVENDDQGLKVNINDDTTEGCIVSVSMILGMPVGVATIVRNGHEEKTSFRVNKLQINGEPWSVAFVPQVLERGMKIKLSNFKKGEHKFYAYRADGAVDLNLDEIAVKLPSANEKNNKIDRITTDMIGTVVETKEIMFGERSTQVPRIVSVIDKVTKSTEYVSISQDRTTINEVPVKLYSYLLPTNYFSVGMTVNLSNKEVFAKKPAHDVPDTYLRMANVTVVDRNMYLINLLKAQNKAPSIGEMPHTVNDESSVSKGTKAVLKKTGDSCCMLTNGEVRDSNTSDIKESIKTIGVCDSRENTENTVNFETAVREWKSEDYSWALERDGETVRNAETKLKLKTKEEIDKEDNASTSIIKTLVNEKVTFERSPQRSEECDISSRNKMRILATPSQVKCESVAAERVDTGNGMNKDHSKHKNESNETSAAKLQSTPTSANSTSYPGSIILLSVKSGVATFTMDGREEKARFPRAAASVDGELVPQTTSLAETLSVGDKVRLSVVEKHTEQDVTVRYLARADVTPPLSKTSEPGLLGTNTKSELNQRSKISTDATSPDVTVTEGVQNSQLEMLERDVSKTGLKEEKLNLEKDKLGLKVNSNDVTTEGCIVSVNLTLGMPVGVATFVCNDLKEKISFRVNKLQINGEPWSVAFAQQVLKRGMKIILTNLEKVEHKFYAYKADGAVALKLDDIAVKLLSVNLKKYKIDRGITDMIGTVVATKEIQFDNRSIQVPRIVSVIDKGTKSTENLYISQKRTTINGLRLKQYSYLLPTNYFSVGMTVNLWNLEMFEKKPAHHVPDMCYCKANVAVFDQNMYLINLLKAHNKALSRGEMSYTVNDESSVSKGGKAALKKAEDSRCMLTNSEVRDSNTSDEIERNNTINDRDLVDDSNTSNMKESIKSIRVSVNNSNISDICIKTIDESDSRENTENTVNFETVGSDCEDDLLAYQRERETVNNAETKLKSQPKQEKNKEDNVSTRITKELVNATAVFGGSTQLSMLPTVMADNVIIDTKTTLPPCVFHRRPITCEQGSQTYVTGRFIHSKHLVDME